jgi:hypothetical protein
MPNTNVYTGADGSLTLSPGQGPEGDKANAVIGAYNLLTVGRVQGVKIEVRSEVRPYHEIGQRYATELRPGNVNIQGSIAHAAINGAMLRLLLGDAADGRPAGSWVQPSFNITLLAENPAIPGVRTTMTLHDVKIDNWTFQMPEDDFVMESVNFRALYLTVKDEG